MVIGMQERVLNRSLAFLTGGDAAGMVGDNVDNQFVQVGE